MFCPTNDKQFIKLSDITAFVCKLDIVTPIKSTNQNGIILDLFLTININAAITKKIWDTAKDLERDGVKEKDMEVGLEWAKPSGSMDYSVA